ncbi:MAG: sel1 repeat family protein [Campylobacter sp.]|nr:sel1 repeat family protein [Campylobacter sp.]
MRNLVKFLFIVVFGVYFVGCATSKYARWPGETYGEVKRVSNTTQDLATKAEFEELEKSGNSAELLALARAYCDDGNAAGCTQLGKMELRGIGVAKDINLAKKHLTYACEHNDADGCHTLGVLYKIENNENASIENFKKASNLGSVYGDYSLGIAYASTNTELSKQYYIKACNAGLGLACTNLATLYRTKAQNEISYSYDLKACELGESKGCFNAATTNYMNQKYEDALKQFIKGCELGNYPSCERAIDIVTKDQAIYSKDEKDEILKNIDILVQNNQNITQG